MPWKHETTLFNLLCDKFLMTLPTPPIGISDFKKLRETKGLYYVDKSLFIRDVLEKPAEV
ncbi:MAG: hypothetical protein HQM12_20705, partial [SAR324 cluster bacterium]|nr:hypothetical protein [SAR324 cluster bacterium]